MTNRDRDQNRSGRRSALGIMFAASPVMLAVLIVVAMAGAIKVNMRPVIGDATPMPVRNLATTSPSVSSSKSTPTPTPTSSSTAAPTPTTPQDDPALAEAAVQAVDNTATNRVRFGVAILDRISGKVTLGNEGSTPFYSASELKLFVIADVLHEQEIGAESLTPQDISYINRALSLSDDNAMDALWEGFDGPRTITEMISLAHLQDTRLPSDLSQWGETVISARDMVAVYQYMLTALNASDQDLVLTALNNAADDGADGFDQSFGLLGPRRTKTIKAKQGWMQYGPKMMLHTTGVLGSNNQYVVALLSLQPMSYGWSVGRDNMDQATAAMLNALGPTAVG
jgi:hypothetical protein